MRKLVLPVLMLSLWMVKELLSIFQLNKRQLIVPDNIELGLIVLGNDRSSAYKHKLLQVKVKN